MKKSFFIITLLITFLCGSALAQSNPFYQLPQLKSIQIDGVDRDWRNKGLAIPLFSDYMLEVCIPFSVIPLKAQKNNNVKFNFFIHDADAENESTTYSWHYFPNTYVNHDAMYSLKLVESKKQNGLAVRANVANNTNYNFQLISYKSTVPKLPVKLTYKDATLANAHFVKHDKYAYANFSFTKPENVDLKIPLLITCRNEIINTISWFDIPQAENPSYKPARFEDQILMFEKEDSKQFPPVGATLFVGSSSIRLWKTLEADFPELNVINRGFGGSSTSDVLYYFDRIVKPYKPAVIVYYTGTNDLAAGVNPVEVTANIEKFIRKVQENLPATKVYVLNHSLAVSRKHLFDKLNEANRLLQEMILKYPNAQYVEVAKSVHFPNGMPRPELFSADSTHMNADGYQKWIEILRPILVK